MTNVLIDGAPIGTTTPLEFTLRVDALGAYKVRYYLNGAHLGQSTVAPHERAYKVPAGENTLEVRVDDKPRQKFVVQSSAKAPAPAPAPEPTPAPTPAPEPTPAQSSPGIRTVTTADELQDALSTALPGDVINMTPGTYVGTFEATASGTSDQRITLIGTQASILTTGSVKAGTGYGLHVTGSYWNLIGFAVFQSAKGIVMDGAKWVDITGVRVHGIGDEGIHFRRNSSFGSVKGSIIENTGLGQPQYGEGVYIGSAKSNWIDGKPDRSDCVVVESNLFIDIPAEGIDIKEGTVGGVVRRNKFQRVGFSGENYADSWVDVKGNGYRIEGNYGTGTLEDAFQVHTQLEGWGNNNTFRDNHVIGGVPGYEVSVEKDAVGTVVVPKPSNAGKGLTNLATS